MTGHGGSCFARFTRIEPGELGPSGAAPAMVLRTTAGTVELRPSEASTVQRDGRIFTIRTTPP